MGNEKIIAEIWKFEGKKVKIRVDSDGKEWFCGRDVCLILDFKNIKYALLEQVKHAYKCYLKDIKMVQQPEYSHPNQTKNYHESRAVYISELGLYQLGAPWYSEKDQNQDGNSR